MWTTITALLSQVLTWMTTVATWFLDPDNQIFVIGFAVSIASTIIGLVFRAFRKRA